MVYDVFVKDVNYFCSKISNGGNYEKTEHG